MTAVAVNSFDIDWTLKIVSVLTRAEPSSIDTAEALDPQRLVPVDERDGKARYALLCHQLRDTCLVPRDDGRGRVGRDRPGHGVKWTD